ncbi:unnamed protein product [Closterium sp. Yama58-4]|nr:unnamed protein product [Closterium sp. Yama58-4]
MVRFRVCKSVAALHAFGELSKHLFCLIRIAAMMQGSINRKKAALIDIRDICARILEPELPLALRLSGILMGGAVIVYSKKVTFLLEDAKAFMAKINAALVVKRDDKTLPREKGQARFGVDDQPPMTFQDEGAADAMWQDILKGMNSPKPSTPQGPHPETIIEDQQEAGQPQNIRDQTAAPESPEQNEAPKRSRQLKRKARPKKVVMDEDRTEVAPMEFNRWLQDTSKDRKALLEKSLESLIDLPLTGSITMDGFVASRWSKGMMRTWNRYVRKDTFRSDPETYEMHASKKARMESGSDKDPEMPNQAMLDDFGSAEAMRERNETPVVAENGVRRDDVTPPAQGLLDLERTKNSSGGVPLPMEEENQPDFYRGNRPQNIADFLIEGSPQIPQNLADDLTAQFPGQSAEKFSSKHSSSGLRGALSQFGVSEPLQETDATQTQFPATSIDKRTASLAGFFRQQVFSNPEIRFASLHELLADCNRQQAARIFYQTCVLATMNYLKVKQATPYSDIEILAGGFL